MPAPIFPLQAFGPTVFSRMRCCCSICSSHFIALICSSIAALFLDPHELKRRMRTQPWLIERTAFDDDDPLVSLLARCAHTVYWRARGASKASCCTTLSSP